MALRASGTASEAERDNGNAAAAEDVGSEQPDRDAEGLCDDEVVNVYVTDPFDPGTDGDGARDGEAVFNGTDPLDG